MSGAANVIDRNIANSNGLDGILSIGANTLTGNVARRNGGLGIYALEGAIAGGRNRASGNAEPQCHVPPLRRSLERRSSSLQARAGNRKGYHPVERAMIGLARPHLHSRKREGDREITKAGEATSRLQIHACGSNKFALHLGDASDPLTSSMR